MRDDKIYIEQCVRQGHKYEVLMTEQDKRMYHNLVCLKCGDEFQPFKS